MDKIITIVQIIVSISLVVVILMQNRGSSLSGVFGGSGSVFRTKRGFEKILFTITIILSILFIGLSLVNVLI
jgi:preprotein translocase subunit SecG